jgi:hypothetical protein
MIDIRRDNALQHLLYKALFERSRNRLEFLCHWLGRPLPASPERFTARPVLELLAWIDSTSLDSAAAERERRQTLRVVESYGVPIDAADRATILRFHAEFMQQGLELRFSSFRRRNAGMYPTLRSLLVARDLAGDMRSYLAREDDWQAVKALHAADRIIPVVGDLAGAKALAAIGRDARGRGLRISALYTSNAEMYVWRDGCFPAFARTVAELPVDTASVIIRSYADRGGHPPAGRTRPQLRPLLRAFPISCGTTVRAIRTYGPGDPGRPVRAPGHARAGCSRYRCVA